MWNKGHYGAARLNLRENFDFIIKDNLLTYIGKVYQKSLILQKISKCHLPKQHFRNFLSLVKPGELVAQMIELKVVWSRKQNFYFGKGLNAKETLDSFNRLKDILKFRTNQLFIEWVVQTINSSQNEETRRERCWYLTWLASLFLSGLYPGDYFQEGPRLKWKVLEYLRLQFESQDPTEATLLN